jgi:hypothetical protein
MTLYEDRHGSSDAPTTAHVFDPARTRRAVSSSVRTPASRTGGVSR